MKTNYALYFQLGQFCAKHDVSLKDLEVRLRQVYIEGRITDDQEEAFWDGFDSLARKFFIYYHDQTVSVEHQ